METPTYQDIQNDVIFKRFFGRRENKDILIDMLNLVISEIGIVDLEYLSPEFTGFDRGSKNSRMDLRVKTDKGTEIDIEVQVENQYDFKDRAVYYASLPILQEIRSGDLRYHLTPRYVLAFLHFGLQHEDHRHWQDGTESRYEILEKYTHEKLSDALNLVFVELGRFRKKSLRDIDNDKERFYFCLLHMHEFAGMPEELKGNAFFERLFEAADFEAMSIEEKNQYIRFMTTERDLINQRQYALDQSWLKGKAEGISEGEAKGKAEGMAEGEAKGKAEGAAEAEAAIIGKLLASGMPASEIARITGIPEEKIQSMI